MKKAITFTIIALIAFAAGRFSHSPKVETRIQKEIVEKGVIKEIIKEKVVEDPEAKAYYEKAFTLFLASIGVQLSNQQESLFAELIDNPKEFSQRKIEPAPPRNQNRWKAPQNSNSYRKKNQVKDFKKIALEEKLKSLGKDLQDPKASFNQSAYIEDVKKLKRFNGEYSGELERRHGDRKGDIDQVYLALDFYRENRKINGSYTIELSNKGEPYSTSNGNGGNNSLRALGNDLIIQTSPFSFIYFKDSRITRGTFYYENKFQGIVRLRRVN